MSTFRKLQVVNPTTNFAEAVQAITVPLTTPEPNQICVRNIYVGVNATDLNTAVGRFAKFLVKDGLPPYDIGQEAVGIVHSIGSAIPSGSISIGQPVLVNVNAYLPGCFTEYSYKTLEQILPIPELKPDYLAVPTNGLTAALALDRNGQIKPSETVLITAAAGGVGQIAVQWAKQKGAYVIGTTSTNEKVKFVQGLGADLVVNYRAENLDQVLSEKFPNGIDVILNTIGGDMTYTLLDHLATRGRLIMAGSISTMKQNHPGEYYQTLHIPADKILIGSKLITGFRMPNHLPAPDYAAKLVSTISDGTIKVRIDQGEKSPNGQFVGLEQIHRAVEWLHCGANLGKVVLQIQDI